MAKIRKKKIKRTKVISEDKEWQRLGEAVEAYSELEQHKADGYRILYLDEVMTTKSTLPMFEWSALNDNMKVDLSQFSGQTTATVAAISEKHGVDLILNFEKSVNSDKFVQFLTRLR